MGVCGQQGPRAMYSSSLLCKCEVPATGKQIADVENPIRRKLFGGRQRPPKIKLPLKGDVTFAQVRLRSEV